MARPISIAVNATFYILLVCFILLTLLLILANGTMGILLFDSNVEIGMDKTQLVRRLGLPLHTYGKGEPGEQDFYRKRGVKPAEHEILTYHIRGFILDYTALVYIDESGKLAEIALWDSDSCSVDYHYERMVGNSRIIVGLWAGFGAFLLFAFVLRKLCRRPPEKPSKNEAVDTLSLPRYPETGFEFDREAASFLLTRTSGAIDKLCVRWALMVFVIIGIMGCLKVSYIITGYQPLDLLVMGIGMSIGFSAPVMLFVIYLLARRQVPRARCSGCSKKMQIQWFRVDLSKYLFLVCPGCKRYVNTGLQSLFSGHRKNRGEENGRKNPAD